MPIQRRRFLQWPAAAATAPLLASCGGGGGSGTPAPPPAPKKNVMVIVIDDLNDWVGFLGNNQVKTPHMDALAAESTNFRQAYCNEPLCNPSRSSAWSGLMPAQTGVFDNWASLKVNNPAAVLLPTWMASHGYEVAQYGKINHVYTEVPLTFPATLPASNLQCSGYPNVNPEGMFDWGASPADETAMPDYAYAQSGIDFLSRSHDKPFMLCVGMVRTHVAWYVPQKYLDMYPIDQVQVPQVPADDLADIPAQGKKLALFQNSHDCITRQNLWAEATRAFMASISFVDSQIGRLMQALKDSGRDQDTTVVLWSDNGFHLGQKFHWHKQALWETTTHVPFLVRQAGAARGQVVDAAVSLIDFMPTVLDITGVPAPYALDGRSLSPLLATPTRAWDHPVLMTNAAMDAQNKYALPNAGNPYDYAVRSNRWRYIRYRDGGQELYDESADPTEYTNVAGVAANADVITQLAALMPAR